MRGTLRSVLQPALLGLLFVVGPSCSSAKKTAPPSIFATTPNSGATGVALMPNIIFEFDRAMDPAFMTSTYFSIVQSGTTSSSTPNVEFYPGLNQVRIIPTAMLSPSTTYLVLVSGLVQSSVGTALGSDTGITITTRGAGLATGTISFATPSIGSGGSTGKISLTWTAATETTTGAASTFTYNVWMVAGSEIEDFLNVAPTAGGATGITFSGLNPGQTYYFKVQPIDQDGNVYAPAAFPEENFVAPP